jgi:hypothetical protein
VRRLSFRHIASHGWAAACLLLMVACIQPAQAAGSPERTLATWYRMVLELVRHTPTYSPPVASRAFAYVGVAAYEATAAGDGRLASLAGQLNGLDALPARDAGAHDEALVLHAAMSRSVRAFFGNTGPTGQRALDAIDAALLDQLSEGLDTDVVERSTGHGEAIADHVIAWSMEDGGAVVENMGFPLEFTLGEGPSAWVPTNLVRQQQLPLLPAWGQNRPFAMPQGDACPLPPPPAYSEDADSEFYREAKEVHDVKAALTDEQRMIARFWSDDPMLSPTPPGHWVQIALQVLDAEDADVARRVEALALVGITVADSFIGCWHSKYEYDLLRPITYIRRLIDPKWDPLLNTPPFPEYPSGHSTQSGAAAIVLTHLFGENYAFSDATHEDDGLPARSYASFEEAAEEAAISRLYGGIHFRAAIERGLDQGGCIGAHATALTTRRP